MSTKKKRIIPAWMGRPDALGSVSPKEDSIQPALLNTTARKTNGVHSISETKRQNNDDLSDDGETDALLNSPRDLGKTASQFGDSPQKNGYDCPRTSDSHPTSDNKFPDAVVDEPITDAVVDEPITDADASTPCRTDSPDGAPSNVSGLLQTRQSCYYGSSCYRKNPQHRLDFAHPGDPDYSGTPSSSRGTAGTPGNDSRPLCEYGTACYRKNPQHRLDYRHDSPQERKARPTALQDIPSDNDGDFSASFGSDDYNPSGNESDDSFVTSDSMDSGNSDYNPEDDDEDVNTKKRKKKAQQKKKEKKPKKAE